VAIAGYQQRALFGRMIGLRVDLNSLGTLVRDEWLRTARLRKQVELDEFVVMPYHFHAILWLAQAENLLEPLESRAHGRRH
jgi:REP element-mobilizing transposase RayT